MSDILRNALRDGGSISIKIDMWANGDFHLYVTETCARLTSPHQSVITAAQLDAAEDPDDMIRAELERMTSKAHVRYVVQMMQEAEKAGKEAHNEG